MTQLLNSVSAVHYIPFQDSYPTRLEFSLLKHPLPFSHQPPITFILWVLPGSIVLKTYLLRHWVYSHFSQAWPGHLSFHETAFLFFFVFLIKLCVECFYFQFFNSIINKHLFYRVLDKYLSGCWQKKEECVFYLEISVVPTLITAPEGFY